ncbi:MAG: BON domain-containing protein [Blastocatellia bacterium]|nr:BON domain-containing protein [Blastocatellia bacterium]
MKRFTTLFLLVGLTILSALPSFAAPTATDEFKLVEKVRKELVTLPFFSVFDNFSFDYKDGIVTLNGQVTRPTLKSDAERVVARVAGVEQVVNNIEVLPLSSFDDRIRLATYRAVYRQPGLDRLAFMANPPVRIIVKNGNVTLEGIVLNEGDRIRAFIAANGVPNVFSVTNNLRTEIAKK